MWHENVEQHGEHVTRVQISAGTTRATHVVQRRCEISQSGKDDEGKTKRLHPDGSPRPEAVCVTGEEQSLLEVVQAHHYRKKPG